MAAGDTLQVDEEPSHTVECEHPLFRVLRVRLAPGAKTRRHRRDVDAVACYFGATRLRVDSGGATTESATGPAAPIATPYSKAPQDRVVANAPRPGGSFFLTERGKGGGPTSSERRPRRRFEGTARIVGGGPRRTSSDL